MSDEIAKESFDSALFNRMLQAETQKEIEDIVNSINEYDFFPYIDNIQNMFLSTDLLHKLNHPINVQKYRNMVAVLSLISQKSGGNGGLAGFVLDSLKSSGFNIDLNNLFSIVLTSNHEQSEHEQSKHRRQNAGMPFDFSEIMNSECMEHFKEKVKENKRILKTQSWREYILDREKQEKEVEQALSI